MKDKEFEKFLKSASAEVDTWPAWKRDLLGWRFTVPKKPLSVKEIYELVGHCVNEHDLVIACTIADAYSDLAQRIKDINGVL